MIWGIVGCSVSPQRARLVRGAMIALKQDFHSAFFAKMDVKKYHKYRSKPGLAHIGPDLGP
jgi:hypothetical protein